MEKSSLSATLKEWLDKKEEAEEAFRICCAAREKLLAMMSELQTVKSQASGQSENNL